MDRGGDEFLTGSRFTANQAGGVRAGNLVDPPVDLAGSCRVADHVGGPDVFLEGVTQFEVLGLKNFALKLGHAPCLDIVGDHAGHDGQELLLILKHGRLGGSRSTASEPTTWLPTTTGTQMKLSRVFSL